MSILSDILNALRSGGKEVIHLKEGNREGNVLKGIGSFKLEKMRRLRGIEKMCVSRKSRNKTWSSFLLDIIVPPGRISAIVNGKRAITADTALRLGRYFGTSPEVWMSLQSDYELRVAQRTIGPELEKRVHCRAA